ncbi:MAG: NAD-binding protein [Actinobacteria bacterium]|nr:NAD-binding protein [Actinomycetota bacterium]
MSSPQQPRQAALSNVFYLVLRRMRFPLVLIVVVYAVCVFVLSLVPGVDADGNPTPGMGLFNAFYVISYTSTTIGFGELPAPYSPAQRLWMVISIYLTVIGWSYSIVTVLSLVRDQGFQSALKASGFARRIHNLHEPFYIVCGCDETGLLICHGLDRLGLRAVIIDLNAQRLQELRLEGFQADAPMITADASQPQTLLDAGMCSPHCRGVMALAAEDETNRAIAVTVRLLAPGLPVLVRLGNPLPEHDLGVFGGDVVINPFERFAEHLASAVSAPYHFRLRELLTGLPGDELPEELHPPRGHWIMCGYGRFGHLIREQLEGAGLEVTVIDRLHFGEDGVDVQGTGADVASLRAAGIDHSVGIVAGNADDLKNLAIAITARDLQPDIFIVTRQNRHSNEVLFEAFQHDLEMAPSRIVAREFLALITTPLLSRFLSLIPQQSDAWCQEVFERVSRVNRREIPEIWSESLGEAEAVARTLRLNHPVNVGNLLCNPYDRDRRVRAVLLLVVRGEERVLLPSDDFELAAEDQLLFAGSHAAADHVALTLGEQDVLNYVRNGPLPASGGVSRWPKAGLKRRS